MALLEGHSSILYGDELYIFGGKDNKTGQLMNTLWKVSAPAAQVAASQFTTSNKLDEETNNNDSFLSSPTKKMGSARELATMGSGAVASVVNTTGQCPTPRCYHSVALRPPFMLVWGGTTLHPAQVVNPRGDRVTEDRCVETVIFALHLETREWGVHVLSGKDTRCPHTRCHATMSATAHSVLMYGGYPAISEDDDTTSMMEGGGGGGAPHLEPNHWSVFEVGADATVRSNARAGSEVPMLWGHTALFAHGCLCVFGGVDFATMTETNALCLFSLEEKRWRWAEFSLAPEARALHTAVLHGSNMYIYGGFTGRPDRTDHPTYNDVWRFSLNTGLWDECACSGALPPARSGHTATTVQNSMFVIGGLEGNKDHLPDHCSLAVLDLHTFSWTMCPITFPMPGSNRGVSDQQFASPGSNEWGNNNNNGNSLLQQDTDNNTNSNDPFGNNNSSNISRINGLKNSNTTPMRLNPAGGGGDQQHDSSSSSSPTSYVPPNMRNNNSSPSLLLSNNNNSNNNNRFNMAGTVPGGRSLTGGNRHNKFGGNNKPSSMMSQQERDLMEAANPSSLSGAAFGNLSAGSSPPPNIIAPSFSSMKSNNPNNNNRNNNRTSGLSGGIPSASGNPNILPGAASSPSMISSRSSSMAINNTNNNSNNNNNPPPTKQSSFGVPNFADQVQQQQQQQQQHSANNNNYGNRGNTNNNDAYNNMMLQNYQQHQQNMMMDSQQHQNQHRPSSSILGGLTGGSDDFSFLNNHHNSNQNQQQFRSPSNALLSNVNRHDIQAQNAARTEKERTQHAVDHMQQEEQQRIINLQNEYNQQGIPVQQQQHLQSSPNNNNNTSSGEFNWMNNSNNEDSNQNNNNNNNQRNMYQGTSSGQRNDRAGGEMNHQRSQAKDAGEGRQGSPALTNVWNTDPDQLPGRRPYGSAIEFSTGSFQAPAHSLREKASQMAQQQAIQQHLDEQTAANIGGNNNNNALNNNNSNNDISNGFGVRPSGGLGRSNSVGLGMPPAMIDTQQSSNNNKNNNNRGSSSSPSRSSSSTSFGRRSMMRSNML